MRERHGSTAHIGRALGLAVVLATAAPGAFAAAAPDFARLDSAIVAEMKATATPGAAVAVVLGDSIVFAKGYGTTAVDGGDPVTAQTLFRVASTSKMLVATALATLAEQGTVEFGQPIATFASGLDPMIGRLTIHQLLAHQAGLFDESSFDGPHDEEALGAFVRTWGREHFFTEPGAVYSYSNPGYVLAGHVLAEAADTTFDAAMARLVFRPLGMTRSTTLPTTAMTWPLAQAHDVGPGGAFVVRPFPDDARYRPNGGVFTSATEFARFALAFVHDGKIDGRQALPPGVIARLSHVQGRRPGGDPADSAGIAYGLVARTLHGVRVLQHGGARLGSGSIVRMAPAEKFAVVILTNRTGSFLPQALERITALALPPPSGTTTTAKPAAGKPPRWAKGEQGGLVGTWVNHEPDLVLELSLDGDTLEVSHPGDPEPPEAVTKIGTRRYRMAGQEVEALPGPDGRPRYLHLQGRALAKRPLNPSRPGE